MTTRSRDGHRPGLRTDRAAAVTPRSPRFPEENPVSTARLPWAPVAQNVPRQSNRRPVTVRFTVTEQLVRRGSIVIAVLGEVDLRSGPVLHTRLQEHVRR